ncbi:hypothetical protein IMAU20067_00705 [Lactobacillus helveticus]|uniref:VRR-NUC domain-containing protein n=1 Tax=Lactobacillus helveticus TaxID=1587 RepID=UPI001A0E0E2D|nr:VRR-NUC domain-containing protein [Lactobacillus helveticus]NRO73871.1 hypothetical protein [Lactobacillus helveticus]
MKDLQKMMQSVSGSNSIKSEHAIQKEIQVALSQHKCSVFRTNVGKVQTIDHRWFDAGLPQGHPDLYGFRWVDNQVFYIEVKSKTGKPRPDQMRFHEMLQSHHVIHGIARSVKDALMIVDGGLCGFGY